MWRRGASVGFQALCLLLFVALESWLVLRALASIADAGAALAALLALPLAFLVADLVSGLVHWWCDNFFAEDTPFLGSALIQPFREHHRDPLAITRHHFLERNHANTLAVLPILAWTTLVGAPAEAGSGAAFTSSFAACFGLAVAMTNQIHGWAHAPFVPPGVRWLQRARLLLHPRHHARHHQRGLAYCITGGWLDAMLERARVFEMLERALRRTRPG